MFVHLHFRLLKIASDKTQLLWKVVFFRPYCFIVVTGFQRDEGSKLVQTVNCGNDFLIWNVPKWSSSNNYFQYRNHAQLRSKFFNFKLITRSSFNIECWSQERSRGWLIINNFFDLISSISKENRPLIYA